MFLPSGASDDSLSVNTQDALNVVAGIDFVIASLEKAGVPLDELQRFKNVVRQSALIHASSKSTAPDLAGGDHNEGVVAEGTLEKLQGGTQGFAPVWKRRWIKIIPGEMQVFESTERPEPNVPCLFSLPLSTQQTRIDPGNEALCKRLGREAILMVGSTTAVGGALRCVTLAVKDDLALEKWTDFLEKAMSKEGIVAGASIFRASQTGDILRVKELISRGIPVNRPNVYGCTALHYAVKNAAECAKVVAHGGDETGAGGSKIRAQEALRVVVLLMSHGADARAFNNLGKTPLDVGSHLTTGFPKPRSLLMSILDSSKYETIGGAVLIVPGKPQLLTKIEEEHHDSDEASQLHTPTVISRGVTFSPSRRDRRAKKRDELAKSRRPYTPVFAAPSFGEACSHTVPVLPRGDHETALGGARHRLAVGLCSRRTHSRKHDPRALSPGHDSHGEDALRCHRRGRGDTGRELRREEVGVIFKDFRMGRSSAVLVGGFKRRRAHADTGSRPSSCPVNVQRRAAYQGARSAAGRPATADQGLGKVANNQADGGYGGGTTRRSRGQGSRGGERPVGRREEESGRAMARDTSVPDSEARRQISEWLRESVGTTSAAPPPTIRAAGNYLVETSSYVATSRRSDVYKALQAIKGDIPGELISSNRLRMILCRVGQPLLPKEMDELLGEADPGETGYVSCSRLSKLVAGDRLEPLAKGATYSEEDDVVSKAKARRLARMKRLETTAAIAKATTR